MTLTPAGQDRARVDGRTFVYQDCDTYPHDRYFVVMFPDSSRWLVKYDSRRDNEEWYRFVYVDVLNLEG